jgi:Transposase and inactivated derivatives
MVLWYQGIFEQLEGIQDKEQGARMSAYMQNRFLFLGIPKPILKQHIKPYLQKSRKLEFDWEFMRLCWEKPYREVQYAAVEYILLHEKQLLDTERHLVECFFNKIKQFRRVATRYDKLATSFLAFVYCASIFTLCK